MQCARLVGAAHVRPQRQLGASDTPSVLALGPTPRNTHPQRRRSLKLFSCRRTLMQARNPDLAAMTVVTASPPARLETPEPLFIPWSNPAPIIPTLIDKLTMARAELSCASRWFPSVQKRGTASSVLWPPIAADVNLKDRCTGVRTYQRTIRTAFPAPLAAVPLWQAAAPGCRGATNLQPNHAWTARLFFQTL